jgi:hypothetical protein
MATVTKIKLKQNNTAGVAPLPADLDVGEVSVNTADCALHTKHTDLSIKLLSPAYTGDITKPTGSLTTSLASVGTVITDSLRKITTDSKGRVVASSVVVSGDIPLLNQNTTGSAAKLTTPRLINGVGFDGTSDISITSATTWGGITGTLSSQTDLNTALNGKQPVDTDLTAIAALTGSSGFLKTNGAGGWSVDTVTYISGNQNITVSGDLTGTGTTSLALTLANSGVAAGTYFNPIIAVDAKGRITSATNGDTFIPLAAAFSNSTVTPTPVTGWTFPVVAGKTYKIEVIAGYQTVSLTTGGRLGFHLVTAVGTIRGMLEGTVSQAPGGATVEGPVYAIGAINLAGSGVISTGVSAINSPHSFLATATFTCTTSGTLNVDWASEVAASAAQLNAASSLIVTQLN